MCSYYTLYNWLSAIYWTPGHLILILLKQKKLYLIIPENKANIKYNVPISLWFVEKNHLSVQSEILDFSILLFLVTTLYWWIGLSVTILLLRKKNGKLPIE